VEDRVEDLPFGAEGALRRQWGSDPDGDHLTRQRPQRPPGGAVIRNGGSGIQNGGSGIQNGGGTDEGDERHPSATGTRPRPTSREEDGNCPGTPLTRKAVPLSSRARRGGGSRARSDPQHPPHALSSVPPPFWMPAWSRSERRCSMATATSYGIGVCDEVFPRRATRVSDPNGLEPSSDRHWGQIGSDSTDRRDELGPAISGCW
jgi:hypothetical protein